MRKSYSRGNVFVEMAVTLPLLLMIILGGAEIWVRIRAHTTMTAISRNLGVSLYRICAREVYRDFSVMSQTEIDGLRNEVLSCLASEARASFGPGALDNASVFVSVYKWNPSHQPDPIHDFAEFSQPANLAHASRIYPARFRSDPSLNDLLRNQEVLVFTEVLHDHTPLLSSHSVIFAFIPETFYALSVI